MPQTTDVVAPDLETWQWDWMTLSFLTAFGLLLLIAIGLWVRAIRNMAPGKPLLADQSVPSPLGFVDLLLVFGGWVIGLTAASMIASSLFGIELTAETLKQPDKIAQLMVINGLAQLMAIGLATAGIALRYRSSAAVGFRLDRLGADLRLGGLAFFMLIPPVLGVLAILTNLMPYQHPTLELLSSDPRPTTIASCWLAAVLVAPVVEEIFFRGILQGWLQRLGTTSLRGDEVLMGGYTGTVTAGGERPWWPILVSSSLFALAHAGHGPAPIPLFLLALGLGYLYRQTSSLVPCIAVHLLLNAYSMFWFTLGSLGG